MFALTVDQKSSRTGSDLVAEELAELRVHDGLLLGPERTVGDEFQLLTAEARTALRLILHLTRRGVWSVGVGVGTVEAPLPPSIREARGEALIHARDAVESAKSEPTRLSINGDVHAEHAQSLVRLLIELRDRRSEKGWEVYDVLAENVTQREAARRLGITPAAVSLRVSAARLHLEEQALPALENALARADADASA
ncbi:DNA-binding protein [Microbacterium soli]|uniref:DNA-binding protein n=1 Tax=Microbacterium soli TaxID=446075 RepID=A0ABP7NDT0_9MICO